MSQKSVFEGAMGKSYPYKFEGTLHVDVLVGGIPSDPKVAEKWLRSKVRDETTEQQIQNMVAKTMVDRGITEEEALRIVNELRNLNGFKRGAAEHDGHEGELYIEGRQLKAALKEAISVAGAAKKLAIRGWGETKKYIQNYFPEHVFILETELWTGYKEPAGTLQQFVHTFRGSSIQYQEYVRDCYLDFTLIADHEFTEDQWAMIWTTGEKQGIGSSRSQSLGTYQVTKWNKVKP